jgi:dihydroxyacetone kinase-like protein
MEQFANRDGSPILFDLIAAIHENKQYLSDIDGAIGDGDHGINMNKGFTLCRDELLAHPGDLTHGFKTLAKILMWKVGGAKAAMGAGLDEVIAEAQKAIDHTRSMGIGLTPCTIPEVGHPNFTIEEGKMEVGIGHHGEPGLEVVELETAAQMAKRMTDIILPDLPFQAGDEVVVLVSGLGSTPLMELYILYNEVEKIFREKQIRIHRPYVGNYFTSLEMAGVTLTVMKLDAGLKACMDYEAESMGLRQFAGR